jgi:hypothetical protein
MKKGPRKKVGTRRLTLGMPPSVHSWRTKMGRCGRCKNCLELERVKSRVLACCAPIRGGIYPPIDHADDGVVQVWNEELKRLLCLEERTIDEAR